MAMTSIGTRYTAFIARHEVAWEIAFAALAVLYVTIGLVDQDVGVAQAQTLALVDLGLTVIFVLEFSTRLAAAPDRRRYLTHHWIDAVALVPLVRGLRVLRLLRLLRLVRAFAGVFRAVDHAERITRHRGLAWLFTTWLAVMV